MGRLFLAGLAGLVAGCGCWAQEPPPDSQPSPPAAPETQEPAKSQPDSSATSSASPKAVDKSPDIQEITIPSGTRVPLTLTNPIHVRTARRGDSVHAVTAFPVTVETQLAIPAGTYVEGTIEKVTKRGASGRGEVQVGFTRMVFANGYAVALDGAVAEARVGHAEPRFSETSRGSGASAVQASLSGNAFASKNFQQPPPPTPPPLPPLPGPRIGTIVGITVGTTAAFIATTIILHRHHGADTLLDSGWRFDMVLGVPVTVDPQRVAAAINLAAPTPR